MSSKRLTNKQWQRKHNHELHTYQMLILGFSTGESVGDVLKQFKNKRKSKL